MIITIDGPAAAGKGTLSEKLAEKYGLTYFDTGMTYRAVGLDLVLQGFNPEDVEKAVQVAKNLTFPKIIELSKHPDFRSNIGGDAASKVSAIPLVRAALLKMQQAVYDGRDTGTVVCPNADVKIFITASPEVRALRRFKEYQQKGLAITYEDVLAQTKERDQRDASRTTAPMKPADDATIIDTSDMSVEEVFNKVCVLIEQHKKTLEK